MFVDCYLKAGDPAPTLVPCRKYTNAMEAFSVQLPKTVLSVWCE